MKQKIKHMMPIPEGYDVYTYVEIDGEQGEWTDLTKEGWAHVLVLCDGGERKDDYIAVYSFDSIGAGEVDPNCKLVKQKICSDCGQPMHGTLDCDRFFPKLVYKCDCEGA